MNQSVKRHATPGTLPLLRGGPSGGGRRRRIDGRAFHAESRRAGLRAAGRRPPGCPHPCSAPLPLRAAATRRLTVPGPRRRLLTPPSPPASAGLQLPLSRAAPTRAALKPAAASAFTGRSQSAGRPFPGQRRPREPSAAAELAAGGVGGGGRSGENGGREQPLPLLAGEGGRLPRGRGRAPGAGSLTVPRDRGGGALRAVGGGGGSRENRGEAAGQQPAARVGS